MFSTRVYRTEIPFSQSSCTSAPGRRLIDFSSLLPSAFLRTAAGNEVQGIYLTTTTKNHKPYQTKSVAPTTAFVFKIFV